MFQTPLFPFQGRLFHKQQWWHRLIKGLLLLGVSFVLIMWPHILLIIFAYLLALGAFIIGFLEIFTAFRLKRRQKGFKEWRNKE